MASAYPRLPLELIEVHRLVWPDYRYDRRYEALGWNLGASAWSASFDNQLFALALGIMPDGWKRFDPTGLLNESLYGCEEYGGGIVKLSGALLISFSDWPEAVRSGRAAEANALAAAHVELERRRAARGGGR